MKSIITSILIAALIIGGAIWLSGGSGASVVDGGSEKGGATSTISNGKQYVDIAARGGYFPGEIKAKAGVPSILRVTTSGTFDCSAALVLPAVGYRNLLPQTGVTEIPIPPQPAGSTFVGTCGMGMYSFAIKFE